MKTSSNLAAVLLLLAGVSSALKLPSYIKACSRNDPNLHECALKYAREALPSILKGDPTYKVPSLNPLKVSELRVEEQGTVGMNIVLTDIEVLGLHDIDLRAVKFDLGKKVIQIDAFLPLLQILGTYNMTGRILILPIKGNGPSNITLENVPLTCKFDYTLQKKKDGKEYINIGETSITFDTTQAHFRFQNLFGGDKLLGENMSKFVRENWREVIQDVGPSFAKAIGETVKSIIGNISKLVPYEDVFPEKV